MPEKNQDIIKTWEDFTESKSTGTRHRLILHYIWLVKYVIHNMNLPANSLLDDEDFLNLGILGLNESIHRFDTTRGIKFESFAMPRIRGIIQDELRKLDWLSRTTRKKAHDFMKAGDTLRSKAGREVSHNEILNKLNVTPEKYNTYLEAAAAAKATMSLSDSGISNFDDEEINVIEEVPDIDQENLLTQIENEERIAFLQKYLKDLTEKKRLVMTLYYYEELTFKEIGKVLNVSESRVCQIHTQVVKDMRIKLNEFDYA